MSSHSYSVTCPNCGQSAGACTDTRPYDRTSIECLHCGFYAVTKSDFMDLEELNERRVDSEMEPLNVLPNQDEDLKS